MNGAAIAQDDKPSGPQSDEKPPDTNTMKTTTIEVIGQETIFDSIE